MSIIASFCAHPEIALKTLEIGGHSWCALCGALRENGAWLMPVNYEIKVCPRCSNTGVIRDSDRGVDMRCEEFGTCVRPR